AARTGVPHLGIELVKNLPLGAFGMADYRFSASARLIQALATFASNQAEFVESIRYEVAVEDALARIEMVPLFRFRRLYPVSHAFAMGFVVRRLRDVLGDAVVKLTSARFVCAAPASTRVHDEFFGVPVEFGTPSYEIAFARSLLRAPLLTANPELAQLLA